MDLTAPTVSYNTVQSRLFTRAWRSPSCPRIPSTSSNDIASYEASNLPLGLAINQTLGFITGIPQSLNSNRRTAMVTVTDTSGNTGTTMIDFPPVEEPLHGDDLADAGHGAEGGSAEYTVVLDIQPTHDVKITAKLARHRR